MSYQNQAEAAAIYLKKFQVVNGQLDNFGKVKITELLKIVDDVVGEHSDMLDAGHHSNLEKELFWVISRYFVVINKMPKLGDELTVKTSICAVSGYQSVRGIQLIKDNDIMMTISTQWLLLDMQQKRPQRIADHYPQRPIENILSNEQLDFPRIRALEGGSKCAQRKARYSDLDSNDHLNNNRYLQWTFDCLPEELLASGKIKSIKTEFLAEVRLNDLIEIYLKEVSANSFLIYGKKNDINKFSVLLEYEG